MTYQNLHARPQTVFPHAAERGGTGRMAMTLLEPAEREYRYGDLTLSSVFQPVFSLSHMRAAGYEALLRAHDPFDRPVPPLEVFGDATRTGELMQLDRLTQSMHLENFQSLGCEREWLFLNVQAGALTDRWHSAALLANLNNLQVPPQRIVLEVLEQDANNVDKLADAVAMFREQGFLIALDDFGCGHSNIDRVWQLQPDIVKLDRSLLAQVGKRANGVSMLPGLTSLLHDAGKLVLIEGVETEAEALMAMECNADFAQGYYFGRPSMAPVDSAMASATIRALTERYRERAEGRERRETTRLAPYLRAFERAAERLGAGESLEEVCWNFLSMEGTARCFLLDAAGLQVGRSIALRPEGSASDLRFLPLDDAQGASWLRRPYFRNAINVPRQVHVTRPYLSINEATLCVTLSIALHVGDDLRVLCGDVNWAPEPRVPVVFIP